MKTEREKAEEACKILNEKVRGFLTKNIPHGFVILPDFSIRFIVNTNEDRGMHFVCAYGYGSAIPVAYIKEKETDNGRNE